MRRPLVMDEIYIARARMHGSVLHFRQSASTDHALLNMLEMMEAFYNAGYEGVSLREAKQAASAADSGAAYFVLCWHEGNKDRITGQPRQSVDMGLHAPRRVQFPAIIPAAHRPPRPRRRLRDANEPGRVIGIAPSLG